MPQELKIKFLGLFNVNKKQFYWIYGIIAGIFLVSAIIAYYENPIVSEDASWIRQFYYANDVVFWVILLLNAGMEALFYWNRFSKAQIEIINEQNTELEQQKEEIFAQKEEISAQRDEALAQKEKIEIQNKLITDSINYAQKIQQAVLPLKEELDIFFDNFIFFKPRDIVSGDFYWFREQTIDNKKIQIIAAADCTGHGVPGGFLSMLGISILNEIVGARKICKTNEILNTLREEIKTSLHQQGKSMEQQDGMDISIISVDKKEQRVEFSGANNSLYFVTNIISEFNIETKTRILEANNVKLVEIKPDRMPIGIYAYEKSFKAISFNYSEGDILYMFSDGYIDQFGGDKRQKFMSKNFKQLLLDNSSKKLPEQKNILSKTLTDWKKDNEQLDDILVMGIKL